MSNLVRFKDWLINLDEISGSDILEVDNTYHLILTMKTNKNYTLICYSQQNAQEELDILTCATEAEFRGSKWTHFVINRIIKLGDKIECLEDEIKKLMRSYSFTKKKLSKKEPN